MIAHYNIQQHSAEWHQIRYGKIGGTLANSLFVKSDNLLDEILAAKCEDFELSEDNYVSYDMQRGIELEPLGRDKLTEYTGIKFKECGWLQCEENELLGISPDGISEDETVTCEIKCPGAKRHFQTIKANEIPLDNIHQCLHYFTVNSKLEKHYFCSFRPENNYKSLFVKELTRGSFINLGTCAKPLPTSITEGVRMAKRSVSFISEQIEEKLKQLSF